MFTEIQGVGNTSLSSQGQSDWYYKRPKKRSNAFQELLDGELEETDAVETLMESALPRKGRSVNSVKTWRSCSDMPGYWDWSSSSSKAGSSLNS